MSLSKVLNKYYGGRWDSFASPTDTIADYDNIRWIGDAASKEEIVEVKMDGGNAW